MSESETESAKSAGLRELLAEIEHEQWLEWSRDVAATEHLSEERLARWRTRWVTYSELSEADKESDRAYADRILALLDGHMTAP